jgi:hypothetical protein
MSIEFTQASVFLSPLLRRRQVKQKNQDTETSVDQGPVKFCSVLSRTHEAYLVWEIDTDLQHNQILNPLLIRVNRRRIQPKHKAFLRNGEQHMRMKWVEEVKVKTLLVETAERMRMVQKGDPPLREIIISLIQLGLHRIGLLRTGINRSG